MKIVQPAGSRLSRPCLPKEADGMAGWLYRLGPGHQCSLPAPADGGGQYLLVTAA